MFALKDNEALIALKQQLQANKIQLTGTVKSTNRGFGFLERKGSQSAFIPKRLMSGILPDTVIVVNAEESKKGLAVTEVKSVIEKGQSQFFCKIDVFTVEYRTYANAIPLRPDFDCKIQLGQSDKLDIKHGDIALIEVTKSQKSSGKFFGHIKSIVGHSDDPSTMWSLVKAEFELNESLEDLGVAKLPDFDNVDYWVNERGYENLTHIPFYTIDSFSSRALDDALYVKSKADYWQLIVAIADPTSIFEDNVELKDMLVARGVTHYLATEIIHLMAKQFSEDNFSLLEDKVRPSLVAAIKINKLTGESILENIKLGIIESRAKLSYDQVTEHIKQRAVSVIDNNPEMASSLNEFYELSQVRLRYREEHNFVGIDDDEFYFVIEEGLPIGVRKVVKTLAHSMVEEAAIAANVCFTEWAEDKGLPILYVTHSGFKEGSFANVKDYITTRGIELKGDETLPCLFDIAHQYLADRVKIYELEGDKYKIALAKKDLVELRGFYQKGGISLESKPHKPMGLKAYATWTSPIRKANDMLNHLVAKAAILGKPTAFIEQGDVDHIQKKNIASRLAERKLWKLLGLTFLRNNLGVLLEAKLTQVMKKAVRMEIVDTGVSITIGVKQLGFDGFVKLDRVSQNVFSDNEPVMRLSDTCTVKIERVDVYTGVVEARRESI